MSVSDAAFRATYQEFADRDKYPPSMVSYWLSVAALLLPQSVWGAPASTDANPPTAMIDLATTLFVAHNLVLEAMAAKSAAGGGIPGSIQGPASSKSVGSVSVSYDTSRGVEPDAGHWDLTIYGLRFIKLARIRGMGPVQVGTGPLYSYPTTVFSLGAWAGPNPAVY